MKGLRILRSASVLLGLTVLSALLICPPEMRAQGTVGNNAAFNSSGSCSPQCVGSSAFIDAYILFNHDICTTLYNILNGTSGNGSFTPGAVIDARGISGTAALSCPASATPWLGRVARTIALV
jgi:hypothetical protein